MSNVYITDLKTNPGFNLLDKLSHLAENAGMDSLNFNQQFTAIKIHFGEPGNLAYIRPNFTRVIAEMIYEKGGKPFLTDAGTLYSGRRDNAIDHHISAMRNGFVYEVTGCPVIIADGLKGTEYREIETGGTYCRTAKIGSAIADADILISMNHFKCHEMAGFGGAIKNIGMGAGSRGGKMIMHSSSKPRINKTNCIGCGICLKYCSQQAITQGTDKIAVIDYEACIGCGQCVAMCRYDAAQVIWGESVDISCCKIAEYTAAVLHGKQHFHINFITQVSPDCDCWGHNDRPIVADIGIAASFDPVALDRACADLVNKAPALPTSRLSEAGYKEGDDKFSALFPNTNWRATLDHAERIGIGSQKYTLQTV